MGMSAPDFGPMAGVKVVHAGQALAGPFAAQLMADYGADVLWIENALTPDMSRSGFGWTVEGERRNQRTLALNIPTEEGREVLLRLLADAEIFIESSKGGQYEAWGLTDEVLWSANPKLVIVHVSGYGQHGEPGYIGRAAFDPIAQAFGCYLQLNGHPDTGAMPAMPFTADYLTALFACSSALAALTRSRATGEGDSVDVAMFEVMMRVQGTSAMAWLNKGIEPRRTTPGRQHSAGMGLFRCRDDREIYVIMASAGVIRRSLQILGLDPDGEPFVAGSPFVPLDSEAGDLLNSTLGAFCSRHDAAEVDRLFNADGIPCSMVYSYDIAEADPHYKAREMFTTWTTVSGERIRGLKVVPEFARRPGQIWRGGPSIGMDTEEVLVGIGYDASDIDRLRSAGVVATGARVHPKRTIPVYT